MTSPSHTPAQEPRESEITPDWEGFGHDIIRRWPLEVTREHLQEAALKYRLIVQGKDDFGDGPETSFRLNFKLPAPPNDSEMIADGIHDNSAFFAPAPRDSGSAAQMREAAANAVEEFGDFPKNRRWVSRKFVAAAIRAIPIPAPSEEEVRRAAKAIWESGGGKFVVADWQSAVMGDLLTVARAAINAARGE